MRETGNVFLLVRPFPAAIFARVHHSGVINVWETVTGSISFPSRLNERGVEFLPLREQNAPDASYASAVAHCEAVEHFANCLFMSSIAF